MGMCLGSKRINSNDVDKGLGCERTPEIPCGFGYMSKLLSELDDEVSILEDRLIEVLGPKEKNPEDGAVESAMASCPMGESLRNNNAHLCGMVDRLRSLCNRLEL